MINITKAQANQSTYGGMKTDWTFTLGDELLFSLPSHFNEREVFHIRDIIHAMMRRGMAEMQEQEQQLCIVKMNRLVEHGDAKLKALREENERLATILETHLNEVA